MTTSFGLARHPINQRYKAFDLKLKNSLKTGLTAWIIVISFPHFGLTQTETVVGGPGATACSTEVVEGLLVPPSPSDGAFSLDCSVKLPPGSVIDRQIVIEGSASSGLTLDCNGGSISGTTLAISQAEPNTLTIRSRKTSSGWDRPEGVTVKNCRISGSTKVYGMGVSANEAEVRESSLRPGHTERAQAAAPTNIVFTGDEFYTDAKLPLYIAPGSTDVAVEYSTFVGRTQTVAIYLDAESAGNIIAYNVFDIRTDKRELIAVDGSARNRIVNNIFNSVLNGGIFLYRNCGEAGTIRHQTPHGNDISRNEFHVDDGKKPVVWLNSRNGNSKFCFTDPSRLFGSSLSPLDYAENNRVSNNVLFGVGEDSIRNQDPSNTIEGNRLLDQSQ
jgi:parallel beta-helix repeat protein